MKRNRLILEEWNEEADTIFLNALTTINNLNPQDATDYYTILRTGLEQISTSLDNLSPELKDTIKKGQNYQKLNDIFIKTYTDASQVNPTEYSNFKGGLDAAYKDFVNTLDPTKAGVAAAGATTTPAAAGGGGAAPAVAAAGAATPAVAQAATGGGTPAATAQGVNKTALFQKYMGSYDPNSSMDKAKMGLVDQALETFKKENKADFTGSPEDITKMNKIMNNVYQSKEYSGIVKGTTAASGAAKTTGQPTVKFGKQDMPTFIQVANGKFIPATQKDVEAGNQIWMKNPRKGQGEDQKPNYVQVRTEKGASLRPKSQLPGALGSVSNLLGDIGRTLDKTSREPKKTPKK